MGDVGELLLEDRGFLEPFLPPSEEDDTNTEATSIDKPGNAGGEELPFVTLTYASSLDSMIALAVGARTTLSGPETKRMTHYLRLRHDAILIGAGTAVVDDPSLNCRYPGATLEDQPRPVIIDPKGRWTGKGRNALALASDGKGKGPWIVSQQRTQHDQYLSEVGGDHLVLPGAEISVSDGESQDASSMSWREILCLLKRRGVNSVMIEGGARVINTLLSMPELVDSVIITIAPTWLGRGGVEVQPAAKTVDGKRTNSAWLQETSWRQFGDDVVLCGKLSGERA